MHKYIYMYMKRVVTSKSQDLCRTWFSWDLRNGMTYYYATASFQCIRMQTTTCDLPTALEYVVILTAVKECQAAKPRKNVPE